MYEAEFYASICEELIENTLILNSDEIDSSIREYRTDQRRIILSPLDELLFMPKRIRQQIYSESKNGMAIGSLLESVIKNFLDLSMKRLAENIGANEAKRWRARTFNNIRNIITAEGVSGILNGSNSVVYVEQGKVESEFEIKEMLILPFGNEKIEIGERKLKFGEFCQLLGKWKIHSGMEPIFDSLVDINDRSLEEHNGKTFHLYIWSDQPISNFQPSLVEQVIRDCIYSNQNPGSHIANVLIFISKESTDGSVLENLSQKELLALNRALNGGEIYLSPGMNEDIFTDPIKKGNRPNSVYESDFINGVISRVKELGIFNTRILNAERKVIESASDLVESSCIAISAECWNGTWAKSLEIDGEQVII